MADASHELRTPVTTIRGYAELYRIGGLADDGELDEAMRRTEQEAVRMARLVDDMLTIAKLGAGRPLDMHPVELTRLLDDAAADARATDRSRPIVVEHDSSLVVTGDEDRLRQVIANVVGNALVHTPPGTRIELRARRDGGDAVIEIADDGPGHAPGGGGAHHRAVLPGRSRRARATAAAAASGCRSPTPPSPPTAARSTSRATSAAARSCACASRSRRPDHDRPTGRETGPYGPVLAQIG